MYLSTNPKSKKEAKKLLAERGALDAFQPGSNGPEIEDGEHCIEGPHYPQPHKWYAMAEIVDGQVIVIH